jgi:hypothetical protein
MAKLSAEEKDKRKSEREKIWEKLRKDKERFRNLKKRLRNTMSSGKYKKYFTNSTGLKYRNRELNYRGRIVYNELIKNPKSITEKLNFFLEKEKIMRRKKLSEMRELAEKEVYGEVKHRRQTIDKTLRDAIFDKFDSQCMICNQKQGLHIHHKDHDSSNNAMKNLLLLCGVCHKKIHMKVR